MPKKSIYWGTLILLLFSTFATASIIDDDEDEDAGSGAETAVEENSGGSETDVVANSAKTSKHVISVSVKNGKAVSPDNEIEVDTDSEIETGVNGKDFWRVDDSISFSFHLPNDASVRVKCALNDECTGEALIQWNGKTLCDENDKRKSFTFDGSNASFELPDLKTNRKENTLTFVCTDGEIGLESLTIYADIEYPSVNINGMFIQLTSPRPGDPLVGKPVTISWEVTKGLADGGWVRILYRTPDMKDWQVVPGLEGITYGAENWGNFTWENPPKAQSCEFKIEYNRCPNPEDERRAEESKKRQAISAAAKELIQAKKSFLDEVNGLVPSSIWKKYLDELRRDHQTLKAKLRKSMKDESNMDLKEVVQTIDALEQIYFTAFMQMMKVAPTIEDEKERNDIQTKVDEFEEMLGQEFSNAREEYGEDEDAKVLLPQMFPKERFEAFKTAKKEFDNALESLSLEAGTRRVWTVNGVEFAFRWCPAGTFIMGSPKDEEGHVIAFNDHEIQHQVTLTKGFWIMETEVTVGMFKAFVNDTGYESKGSGTSALIEGVIVVSPEYSWRNPGFSQTDNYPVTNVSWYDAVEFCKWLSRKTGQKITLPTEAQWEYACRAGSTGAYAGNLDEMAWYRNNSGNKAHPVGTKKPNAWGLYDMHGNVCEWCADYWNSEYPSGSVTDPMGPSNSPGRVSRDGGWHNSAQYCRSAHRGATFPECRGYYLGFRCVRSITRPEN